MLCEYGCGQLGLFKTSNNKNCCAEHRNSCPSLKLKNATGLAKAHAEGRMPVNHIPIDKLGWRKGQLVETKNTFKHGGIGNHKALLIAERGHVCESCNNTEWQNNPIPLELDHINGKRKNNRRKNLRLLCCNCHALTPTWRGRNIRLLKVKYISNSKLISALQSSTSIRKALEKVGLTGKGANYVRCKKLIKEGICLKLKTRIILKPPEKPEKLPKQINTSNSQFGKLWICHLTNQLNKKISQDELNLHLELGWISGRVMRFENPKFGLK